MSVARSLFRRCRRAGAALRDEWRRSEQLPPPSWLPGQWQQTRGQSSGLRELLLKGEHGYRDHRLSQLVGMMGTHLRKREEDLYGYGDEDKERLRQLTTLKDEWRRQEIHYHSSQEGISLDEEAVQREEGTWIDMDMDPATRERYIRQQKMETRAVEEALERYIADMESANEREEGASMPASRKMLVQWFHPMKAAIEDEIRRIDKGEKGPDRSVYGPYLKQMKADKWAVLTLHNLTGLLLSADEAGTARVAKLAITIAKACQAELNLERMRRTVRKARKELNMTPEMFEAAMKDGKSSVELQKIHKMKKLIQKGEKQGLKFIARHAKQALDENVVDWGNQVLAKIGTVLIKMAIDNCTVNTDVGQEPAFFHGYTLDVGGRDKGFSKRFGVIRCNKVVLDRISDGDTIRAVMTPRYMPMVVPPRQWTRCDNGGYLSLRAMVMRTRGSKLQVYKLRQADKIAPYLKSQGRRNITQVYEALNALGNTPWQLNRQVYDVVDELWQRGVKRKNRELHSLRCDTEYKLQVGRELYDEPEFFFPHNLDFRGRAYPMHPYLNHLGNDMCRGVLVFARPHKLGERGFFWLCVHLANVYGGGADKLPFEGRSQYALDNMEHILDSADNPVDGSRWWLKADRPFQCLAICMDIAAAWRSGDITNYESRLPVAQDGSCNGLQHYAALGRDKVGGQSVNLLPLDAPADVYSGIAKLVAEKVETDAAGGNQYAQNLLGNVDRKLVKQTVMTSVYGVTFVGAREQISNRLRERGWEDDEQIYRTSCYAARVTLNSLHAMFRSAKDVMGFLSLCAVAVAKNKHAVNWVTPIGLPVVQPYRNRNKHAVRTLLQRLVVIETSDALPVAVAKQRSAFPPNYIHSIDSTHMLMTATRCHEKGLAFAGVHDSFWTHAGSVDEMNSILREAFIELHKEPLIEDLLEFLATEYHDVELPDLPEMGSLNLDDVRDADYFFN